MANRPLTIRITADTEEALHGAIAALAETLPDPDHISAIRLGTFRAEVELMPRPVKSMRLH